MRLVSLALIAFTCVLSLPHSALGQALPAAIERINIIPKGYKSYELFLICNAHWLGKDKTADLSDLNSKFEDFGDMIGNDNLAVWFWKKRWYNEEIAKNVDIQRSISFCRNWGLDPSKAPYVVVLEQYPKESSNETLPKNSGVFALGNLSKPEIGDLLDELSDDLLKYDHLAEHDSPAARPTGVAQQPFWIRILYAIQQSANSFGCGWSFELSSGPTKTKWEPCKGKD